MKPVEHVSIGGCLFTMEEDACATVRNYLGELSAFYSGRQGGDEVMEGIEERFSELLSEQAGQDGVVVKSMADAVIETLGRPEAIEEESGEETGGTPEGGEKVKRRLYRDPSSGKVAGVCSGLGAYFDLDPTIFRLIFIIFSLVGLVFGHHRLLLRLLLPELTFPVVYLILWICMPVARTVRQRDELRGEKGTVDAISARVMDSVHGMGETAGRVVHSSFWSGIWRIMEVCIGIILLVVGVAGVVSLGCLAFSRELLYDFVILNEPSQLEMLSCQPLVVAMAFSLVLPFIWFIYTGIMLLFKLKAPKWHPGLCLFVIWLVTATVLAVLVAYFNISGLR